jgi:hypothetical protein
MGTGAADRPAVGPVEKPTDAIAALLQERRRFEQWLATLESRRAITPPHVYGRVHADYSARLSAVLDELGGRSAELQQSVESLTGRVAALQNEESVKRDERYEAELRAAVGEFTQDKWLQISEAADVELARLGAQRTELTAELAQVQQLLVQAKARQPVPPVAPVPPAVAAPVMPAAAPPPPMPPATVPGSTAKAPPLAPGTSSPGTKIPPLPPLAPMAPAKLPDFSDLASDDAAPAPVMPPPPPTLPFAAPGGASRANAPRPAEPKTGDGAVRRAAAAAPAQNPPAKAEPEAAPAKKVVQSTFDELEFLKSVVDHKTEGKGQPAVPSPAPAPAPASGGGQGKAAASSVRPATPPEAGTLNDISLGTSRSGTRGGGTDSVPVFLRDVPTEQAKTLKCQECGSMNYPTEWYCERCGGELAAM